MEKKMNVFTQFYNSITRLEAYKYFLKQSLGKAFLYLLLLSIILGGISGARIIYDFNVGINDVVNYVNTDFPDFQLQNGQLQVNAQMPYVIEESEEQIIIIDTSDNADATILNDYDSGIFISKYGIENKKSAFETQKIDFASLEGLTFTKADVLKWLPYLKWLTVIIMVFGFFFYLVGKIISALLVSVGGIIISKVLKHKISFGNLYKLSIYCLTASILLNTLIDLTGLTIPFFSLIYYGIALVYLWKVIKLLKNDEIETKDIQYIETRSDV